MIKNSKLNKQLRALIDDMDPEEKGKRKVINWPMVDFRKMIKRLVEDCEWWNKGRYYFSIPNIENKATSCFLYGIGREFRITHYSETGKIDVAFRFRKDARYAVIRKSFDAIDGAEKFIRENFPSAPENTPKKKTPDAGKIHDGIKKVQEAPVRKKIVVVRKHKSDTAATVKAVEKIEVYTDGGCHGNPGPGGWGCVIIAGGKESVLSGGDIQTTNNRMELTAAIMALEAIGRNPEWKTSPVQIFTDSQYVKNGITQWIESWKKNGWKTSVKKPVLNRELWERLDSARSKLSINWVWVKGHAGIRYNEICDQLCQQEIAKF